MPFNVSMSDSLLRVEFNQSFHAPSNYQALIDNVLSVLKSRPAVRPFDLLIDWKQHFIQIPVEQKLCIQYLGVYKSLGLQRVANVSPEHPVVDWQIEQLRRQHPDLRIVALPSVQLALAWLSDDSEVPTHRRA